MRFKLVPPPPEDISVVTAAQRSVPLVAAPEADCVVRIVDRLDLPSRKPARTWLTFLRALELVRRTEQGFVRTRRRPSHAIVAAGLQTRVLGASEVLAALGSEPRTVDYVFAVVSDVVPQWERTKDPTWEQTWRTRVERLLGWLVLVSLARRVDQGYVYDCEDGGQGLG